MSLEARRVAATDQLVAAVRDKIGRQVELARAVHADEGSYDAALARLTVHFGGQPRVGVAAIAAAALLRVAQLEDQRNRPT